MKKLLSIIFCIILSLPLLSLAGCGKKMQYKFGMGIHTEYGEISNASADKDGQGKITETFACVLVDKQGRIQKCAIDATELTAKFTNNGKFIASDDFKTKYEQGDAYGMKKYGGAQKEWYEQVDAFRNLVLGKKLKEVEKLVAAGGKGNDTVMTAGCTIKIDGFIKAIKKACESAAEIKADSNSKVNLGIVSTQSDCTDATAEKNGTNQINSTVTAALVKTDGDVAAAVTDCIEAKFTFDKDGNSTTDTSKLPVSKKEQGDNYGMAKYGTDFNGDGIVKEWYRQAAEFDKALVSKDAKDISALEATDGHGNADLQSAGCTVTVTDFVKSAVKAATVS